MIKYRCYDINWDFDPDEDNADGNPNLPTTLEVTFTDAEIDEITNVEDALSDEISEKMGFCHNGFKFEQLQSD